MDKKRDSYIYAKCDASNAPSNQYFPMESKIDPSDYFHPIPPRSTNYSNPLPVSNSTTGLSSNYPANPSPSGVPNRNHVDIGIWNNGRLPAPSSLVVPHVPSHTATNHTTNLGLDKLIKNLPPPVLPHGNHHQRNSIDGSGQICSSCDPALPPSSAHSFCTSCQDYLCDACVAAHRRVRLTRGHDLRILSSNQPTSPHHDLHDRESSSPFANQTYFCHYHNEECGFWCSTCSRKCCQTCLRKPEYHGGHEVMPIVTNNDSSSISPRDQHHHQKQQQQRPLQQEINNLQNHANLICNHMESCLNELRIYNQTIQDNHITATNQLKTYFDEIVVKYSREKEQLQFKLEAIKEERLQSINERIDTLFDQQKQLKYYVQNVCTLNQSSIKAFKQLVAENQNFHMSNLPNISSNDVKIAFKPMSSSISIGRIVTSASASNTSATGQGLEHGFVNFPAQFKIVPKGLQNQTVEIENESDIEIIFTPISIKYKTEKHRDGSIVVQWIPGEAIDYRIQILYKKVPIKDSPWIVKVTQKRDYRHLSQPEVFGFPRVVGKQGSKNGELNRPWGVCAIPDGGFCVADRSNNRLQFFSGEGDHWYTYPNVPDGEELKNSEEPGKFNRPAGVAFTFSPITAVVVADKDNHRVQVFQYDRTNSEVKLKLIRKFGEQGPGLGQFNYPWDVACNHRGDIVVSDSRNRRVQLFDFEGNYLRNYGFKQAVSSKHFDYPRGVCFDRTGKICVTDFNIHRLFIINEQMTEAFYIGSEGTSPQRFNRPQGITVDMEGRIIVVDTKNKRIQFFQSDGTFLMEYGKINSTKGNSQSHFVRPAGICITTEGKIIIVEEDEGHRIQII